MTASVVDASVAAAWLLPEEAPPYTEAMLVATAAGGAWVLAQRRALPLATLDRKLLAAMRGAGVPQAAP